MNNMNKMLLALMIISTTFSPMAWAEQDTTQSSQQQVKPTNNTAQQKPKPATTNVQQQKVTPIAQTKLTANTQQTTRPKPNHTTTQVKPTTQQQQAKPRTTTSQQKPTPSIQLAKPVNNSPKTKPTTTAVVATAATVVAAAQGNTSSEQTTPIESTTQAPLYNPAMAVVPNVAGATKSDVNKATTDAKVDKTKLSATQVVVSKEVYERYQNLEQRNDETVAQNQELQMQNDNLSTQVKVLESERTAQLLFYGAMILLVGAIFGFLTGYLFARRQRPYL
ncbi:hypothetical protein [Moraxella sp. ZY210820]|uniref:hypothetical protein n=1 Tax=unclassified Moraxella TaxID=2685852 RepID=UPI002731A3BC|nr:hypothetical protein [Moraxella sp. ZY210820]WLF84348.1 hypothetical protein LU301_02290 [Moraxella sp. ZY210820]